MKLMSYIFIFLLFLISPSFADDFIYLQDGIYYKKDSLKYNNGYGSAEFKVISDKDSTYSINKYRAYCDPDKGLKIMAAKKYNTDGILLENYIAKERYGYSDYTGLINGHIYYGFICKKYAAP